MIAQHNQISKRSISRALSKTDIGTAPTCLCVGRYHVHSRSEVALSIKVEYPNTRKKNSKRLLILKLFLIEFIEIILNLSYLQHACHVETEK